MVTLAELKNQWPQGRDFRLPPPNDIVLWAEKTVTIYISSGWGAPIPYPRARRHDGAMNFGYRRLKNNLDAISDLPEVERWPELADFLRKVNSESSPVESVGCEMGFFENKKSAGPPLYIGSYVELIFTEHALDEQPENFLNLVEFLANSMEGCESWWASLEFGIERMKFVNGTELPWGLCLKVQNAGRDESEARRFFEHSLKKLSEAIASLPRSFPRDRCQY
jgi:hypothetical protein